MRFLPLLASALVSVVLAAGDTASARKFYDAKLAPRTVPLLQEVLRFPTVQGNVEARQAQQAWVKKVGAELGFVVRDAGLVTEVELPAPDVDGKAAPVLGLVVHGDVQPVDDHWTIPPFQGAEKDGFVLGRGAADDKGPLVQALLAMKALKEAGAPRTHTIRLMVGSDEESTNLDIADYLKTHAAPDYSLVLDSAFPVVVGEKAWNALTVETGLESRGPSSFQVESISAGLAPSIVPDLAALQLSNHERNGESISAVTAKVARKKVRAGFNLDFNLPKVQAPNSGSPATIVVVKPGDKTPSEPEGTNATTVSMFINVHGKAAHAGVNAEGGRNALVALANLVTDELPAGGAKDLLAFVRLAGQDLTGTGLGLTQVDPVFSKATVVPSLLQMQPDGRAKLTINIRSTPTLSGEALKAHLFAQVAAFNARTGAHLEPGGFFGDRPLAFDPNGKLVKRLLAAYARGMGKAEPPAISGGGTYAKRLPRAIAFGMWFPGQPYPGHDVDEKLPVADLHKGVQVLLEALGDLACGAPLQEPFKP